MQGGRRGTFGREWKSQRASQVKGTLPSTTVVGARATGAEAVRASAGLVWPEEEKAPEGFQKVTGLNFLLEAFMAAEQTVDMSRVRRAAEMPAEELVVTLTIQGLEPTQRTTSEEGIQFKSRHKDFPGMQGTRI